MFSFIHAADIHLDSPLKGLEQYEGAPVDEIRGATRRALENLVDVAIDRDVDFVLIAGDLYDGDWKDHNTGLYFVSQMSRLRETKIPVLVIRGNHDAESRMTKSLRLPDNVEVLSHTRAQTAKTRKLADLGVAVHGKSFAKAAEYENLAQEYPEKKKGMFNIGLLHTSLGGAEGHEPYAPCTIEELRQKEYDYWALGHVHQREVKHEDPPMIFCGNIQGRHIREPGEKGCYVVTVDEGGGTQYRFEPLDVFRWARCEVEASGAERGSDVLDLFSTALSELTQQHEAMPMAVRVEVTGRCRAHEQLAADAVAWINQIRATALDAGGGRIWVEKVSFRTGPERDIDGEAMADGPIGELLRYCTELREDKEQLLGLGEELEDLWRKLPDDLKRGEERLAFDDPQRLREILADVQPLLCSRLLEETDR